MQVAGIGQSDSRELRGASLHWSVARRKGHWTDGQGRERQRAGPLAASTHSSKPKRRTRCAVSL
jgi:hypothetical protein